MNLTMQQPLQQYPFYMDTQRFHLPPPWSSVPFHYPAPPRQQFHPSYQMPQPSPSFTFSQEKNPVPRTIPSSYSNTRYNHLKKSTSYSNRRFVHQSFDLPTWSHRHSAYNEPIYTQHYRPSKTKSILDFEQIPQFTSAPLSKAHSWHAMMNHRRSNLSVAYANENHLTRKRPRKHSLRKKKINPPQRRLSSSLKRKPSFKNPRIRSIQIPERGIVRISTLDEMPIINKQTISISNERLSTKGSISNASILRMKSKGHSSIKNRKIKNNNEDHEGTRASASPDTQSSSSSNHSHSSLQQRLNGSLRNDPLISAAMEDLRQFRRSSSQNTLLIPPSRVRSRDSLHSDSTFRSSPSLSITRSNSQSSFTSQERSDIRHLIKTIKTKDKKSSPIQSSPQSITPNSHLSTPRIKTKKSCIAEELDREFSKLRARDPDQEITYVTPSSICKRKKTNEKPCPNTPPIPTFDELLRQVRLRPVDRSIRSIPPFKEKITDGVYENPLSPVPVPISSPAPSVETKLEEIKHEYAIPIKRVEEKPLPQISHFQPMRNFSFKKPGPNILPEKRPSRPLSMFNWFHSNSPNPVLSTFQPNRNVNHQNEYGTTSVNENIYTSDIEVYLPISTIDKNDDDNSLQIHLDNQTILTDDFYSDYDIQQTANSSSILNDFSHLFTRKHKHQNRFYKKNPRCSIM